MVEIKNTLVSDDVFDKKFVCNLKKCKGICCVEGESGAPLDKDELPVLNAIFENIKPYLSPEGINAIETQGKYVVDEDGDDVTPLIHGGECAYAIHKNGQTQCGIEEAYYNGATDFIKPISCHLYPIRITEYKDFTALNYHAWDICSDACQLGEELGIEVFRFLKQPIVRKFGEDYYNEMEKLYDEWKLLNNKI